MTRTVTVAVVGGETVEVTVDADATYADLLAAVDLGPHEATALVDGRPVPEDAPVAADEVRVLRLVRGGRDATAVTVREATPDDRVAVLRTLEGALLDVDPERVRERVAAGEALVAERRGSVGGALVRDGDRVLAVAVRRRWRRRGVGTALVERAVAATGRLTATFDPRVRGFYEALGFEIAATDEEGDDGGDDRLRGVRG